MFVCFVLLQYLRPRPWLFAEKKGDYTYPVSYIGITVNHDKDTRIPMNQSGSHGMSAEGFVDLTVLGDVTCLVAGNHLRNFPKARGENHQVSIDGLMGEFGGLESRNFVDMYHLKTRNLLIPINIKRHVSAK